MLENFVMMELRKQVSWHEDQPKLYHFRTPKGFEVDAVLEPTPCPSLRCGSGEDHPSLPGEDAGPDWSAVGGDLVGSCGVMRIYALFTVAPARGQARRM